jgi:IS4 transposase
MPVSKPVFSQVVAGLHGQAFARCVALYPMRRCSRSFSAYDHFLALCFGQLTYRESLRDIIACLNARPDLQYHLGFRGRMTRTNFAYANEHRDWRVFAAVAEVLIRRATRLYRDLPNDPALPELVYALDASLIHLSLKLFPWAYWSRSCASALKLHTLISLKGNLPVWAAITEASLPELKMLDHIPLEPGAFYVMDRGYLDFTRLIRLQQAGAYFVVRSKRHVRFQVVVSRPVDKSRGLRCDQTIRLNSTWSKQSYSLPLRRIRFRDQTRNRSLVFLTNNFELPADVICELYQRRWQVELFFKWTKQHLRIRRFFGRSRNAIHCQIWTAICAYLLVAIAKRELKLEKSLYEILQILSVSAFEQIPVHQLFAKDSQTEIHNKSLNTPYLLGF